MAYIASGYFATPRQYLLKQNQATYTNGDTVTVRYQIAGSATVTGQEILASPTINVKLLENENQTVVAGTVRFKISTVQYSDRDGRGLIYLNDNTLAGSIDYDTGIVSLTTYTGGENTTFVVESLILVNKGWFAVSADFRTTGSPVQPGGLFVSATALDGTSITATADLSGEISDTLIEGVVNYSDGIVRVNFGESVLDSGLSPEEKLEWWYDPAYVDGGYIFRPKPVAPNTIRFNSVIYNYLPLSEEIIGLDLIRLPSNGKVPKYRAGDILVIHEPFSFATTPPLIADQVVNLPHTFIGKNTIYLVDDVGAVIPETGYYTVDEELGTVTMDSALDLTGFIEPLVVHYRLDDMQICTGVQIDGTLDLLSPFAQDFSTNAFVSTAVIFGDLFSKIEYFFSQKTWSNNWANARSGEDSTAKYNLLQYPIFIQNKNAIKERWALVFTNTTTFNIIGETVGVIGTGNISSDTSPLNPQTLEPYWVIYTAGMGGGWAAGNVIRFNTRAAAAPIWIFRSMEAGA